MATLTQPLRDEHRSLWPRVEQLREAADAVGTADARTVSDQLAQAHDFLTAHLIPHATAEEYALYPAVERILGAPGSTATMARDHVEVARLAQELGKLRERRPGPDTERAVRRVLYGLYALLKVHFAKEEEVYLPLLDARLAPAAAEEMFSAMHQAAGKAKARTR